MTAAASDASGRWALFLGGAVTGALAIGLLSYAAAHSYAVLSEVRDARQVSECLSRENLGAQCAACTEERARAWERGERGGRRRGAVRGGRLR